MKRYKKQGLIVKVDWEDAWSTAGWRENYDHSALKVASIGFVRKHDKKGIAISFGKDENDTGLGVEFIPSGMIRKITRLK